MWVMLNSARKATSGEGHVGEAILTAASLVAVGSLLIRPASKPFRGIIDRVYFGNSYPDETPVLNLRLARAYRSERCFEKAIEECERQLEWHSLSPELWAELLLCYRGARDRDGEASALDRALQCLGMESNPSRFAKIVKARDDLPRLPEGMASQFER